jgi:hypothetical protein
MEKTKQSAEDCNGRVVYSDDYFSHFAFPAMIPRQDAKIRKTQSREANLH